MTTIRIAAIDIGTETTRLLIADVTTNGEHPANAPIITEVHRESHITQLGEGLSDTGVLSATGLQATLDRLEMFSLRLKVMEVRKSRCVATSAVRDASNAKDLIDGAARFSIHMEVIEGTEEAQLAFAGATYGSDAGSESEQVTLVVDPGGGSTEFVLGTVCSGGAPEIQKAISLQVGSRRMTDLFLKSDPPTAEEIKACKAHIKEAFAEPLAEYKGKFDQLVAVAGTATTLAAILGKVAPFDPKRIQGYKVSSTDISDLLRQFTSANLEQRQQIIGLEPARASVIIAGTLILEVALETLGKDSYKASDRDLLYGIILSAVS